uniref:Uncharacterized protein n=1 Tax=Guillardia theta TaxID=55529 RepID=A0A7S4NVK4_GUITH|mmetsp:Transcript_35074/g.109613  ORF Transcript_35074/g.109613 Transcript_35074/m.109613 type:complete len:873 (+) Transcript_35074:287-2905(+)
MCHHDLLADVGGMGQKQLETISKTLEDEKRRLAQMELQMQQERARKEGKQQELAIATQTKELEGMMKALMTSARDDVEKRQRWEDEWRRKFDEFRRQHHEMESALKHKHFEELKKLKESMSEEIRKMADGVGKKKGTHNAPSDAELKKIQKENVGKILLLFQKQGKERLYLSSKLAKQEELLIMSKNESLQKHLNKVQSKTDRICRQMLPSIDSRSLAATVSDYRKSSHESFSKQRAGMVSMAQTGKKWSRSNRSALSHSGRSNSLVESKTYPRFHMREQDSLPSPRIDSENVTFLTEIGSDFDQNLERTLNHFSASRSQLIPRRSSKEIESSVKVDLPKISQAPKVQDQNVVKEQQHPKQPDDSGVVTSADHEFKGWAPATITLQENMKPRWDDAVNTSSALSNLLSKGQWHPSIIAFQSEQNPKRKVSPYMSLSTKSKVRSVEGVTGRKGLGQRPQHKRDKERAASTQPVVGFQQANEAEGFKQGHSTQPLDRNFSRPRSDLGLYAEKGGNSYKSAKLETWIEEKIRNVLGENGTKESIFKRLNARNEGADESNSKTEMLEPRHTHTEETLEVQERTEAMPRPEVESVEEAEENVSNLLNRLKSSMSKAPKLEQQLEAVGIHLEEEDDRQSQENRPFTQARDIEQNIRGTEISNTGRVDRQGNYQELEASADVNDRRNQFSSLTDSSRARSRSDKRVGWDLDDRDYVPSRVPSAESYAGSEAASFPNSSRSEMDERDAAAVRPNENERNTSVHIENQNVSDDQLKDFFSKIRHNKVAEVEDLVQSGFPLDRRDAHGNTPLMVASQNGHKRLVKMILRNGADPNATNHQGNTALHFATAYGYNTLSKYLMSKGADDTLINMKGLTCYDGLG